MGDGGTLKIVALPRERGYLSGMKSIAVIGAGPAGLIAAETIAAAGHSVTIFDHTTSPGRKFLMAGRGGLNLTHSEPFDVFLSRFGSAAEWLAPKIQNFSSDDLRQWCHALGQQTFVGSSGRIFPQSLKASPLLRAWLRRLDSSGVRFFFTRKWVGWDDRNNLIFMTPDGKTEPIETDGAVLALGGASWPRLGSNGGWVDIFRRENIAVTPLQPSNCGFVVPWSDIFRTKFQGQPLKPISVTAEGITVQGEAMISAHGIEGGAIYALSSPLRKAIKRDGTALLAIDLRPGLTVETLTARLDTPRGAQSFTNYLRKCGGLSPLAIGLIYETAPRDREHGLSASDLAKHIKSCPLRLTGTASIDRAISTAGGVRREALDDHLMLRAKPGVFIAGEMLDWEAPTGGYLLQATFSTGVAAARGLLEWVDRAKV